MFTNEFVKHVANGGHFFVLDTETTGLSLNAEICQIAIVDSDSEVVMDTLVKPHCAISDGAIDIHGITNHRVKDAPPWSEVRNEVRETIRDDHVVIYNASFDIRLMQQSDVAAGFGDRDWSDIASYHCAMLAFAEWYGEWSEYRQAFKWQPLRTACRSLSVFPPSAHTAHGDCLSTLIVTRELVKRLVHDVN